jgi:hypothetical protein
MSKPASPSNNHESSNTQKLYLIPKQQRHILVTEGRKEAVCMEVGSWHVQVTNNIPIASLFNIHTLYSYL